MDQADLKRVVEAALLAADEPLTLDQLARLFRAGEVEEERLRDDLKETLRILTEEADGRGYELARVASGFRYQVRQELSPWISRLWEEKPPRYTRALLETLALIAYRQPVTRGDIEQVRGVSVSQNIMRTLIERGWIRVVGQREVPGRPVLYGTTRAFLDYFNLKSLDQLPPLAEIRALIEPLVVEEVDEPRERLTDGGRLSLAAAEAIEDEDDDDDGLGSDVFDAELAAALEKADAAAARFRAGTSAEADDSDAADAARAGTSVDTERRAHEEATARPAQVVDVITDFEGEDHGESQEREQPSAKVVKLPTSSSH